MSRPGTKNIHFVHVHGTVTFQNTISHHSLALLPADRITHLLPWDFLVFGRLAPLLCSSNTGKLDAYPCSASASATSNTAIPSKSADRATAKIDGSHVDVCVYCARLTIIQTKKIQFTSVAPVYVFSGFEQSSNTHIYYPRVSTGIHERDANLFN